MGPPALWLTRWPLVRARSFASLRLFRSSNLLRSMDFDANRHSDPAPININSDSESDRSN